MVNWWNDEIIFDFGRPARGEGLMSQCSDDPKELERWEEVSRNYGKLIARAIDAETLEWRGKEGEEIPYAPKRKKPYTGSVKVMHENGKVWILTQFKAGKEHGLEIGWSEDGTEEYRMTYKSGKIVD